MLRAIVIFAISFLDFIPICVFVGYGIGYAMAIFVYPETIEPSKYKVDRELFAGIYGVMFIGSFLYIMSTAFAVFRLVKAIRISRS